FVPILHEAGMLGPDANVACGTAASRPTGRRTLEELNEMQRDRPAEFERYANASAGGYAYALGYRDPAGAGLHGVRRESDYDRMPVMADRPPFVQPAGYHLTGNSLNHGGTGQNVLHLGGDVSFCTQRTVGVNRDDI